MMADDVEGGKVGAAGRGVAISVAAVRQL